ncbi:MULTISPECIES: hypothetical protein [Aeromonas]|uniref:hypothetical protein n=1 Tax=Aeromonas TaxID=642 RepID=UPI000542F7BC|nr:MULTISPECIES: hypothetical protein [Aeromonas]KHE13372.1 hypothetical protein OI71_19915 [Aeromonas hydrophila]
MQCYESYKPSGKNADYKAAIEDNPDSQNWQLDLYKRYASVSDFKRAFEVSASRLLTSAASATILG